MQAVGIDTGKIYTTGENRSEIFRKLNELYPSKRVATTKIGVTKKYLRTRVLPEAIKIVKDDDKVLINPDGQIVLKTRSNDPVSQIKRLLVVGKTPKEIAKKLKMKVDDVRIAIFENSWTNISNRNVYEQHQKQLKVGSESE